MALSKAELCIIFGLCRTNLLWSHGYVTPEMLSTVNWTVEEYKSRKLLPPKIVTLILGDQGISISEALIILNKR